MYAVVQIFQTPLLAAALAISRQCVVPSSLSSKISQRPSKSSGSPPSFRTMQGPPRMQHSPQRLQSWGRSIYAPLGVTTVVGTITNVRVSGTLPSTTLGVTDK